MKIEYCWYRWDIDSISNVISNHQSVNKWWLYLNQQHMHGKILSRFYLATIPLVKSDFLYWGIQVDITSPFRYHRLSIKWPKCHFHHFKSTPQFIVLSSRYVSFYYGNTWTTNSIDIIQWYQMFIEFQETLSLLKCHFEHTTTLMCWD